jgi:hypothetical protein
MYVNIYGRAIAEVFYVIYISTPFTIKSELHVLLRRCIRKAGVLSLCSERLTGLDNVIFLQ